MTGSVEGSRSRNSRPMAPLSRPLQLEEQGHARRGGGMPGAPALVPEGGEMPEPEAGPEGDHLLDAVQPYALLEVFHGSVRMPDLDLLDHHLALAAFADVRLHPASLLHEASFHG